MHDRICFFAGQGGQCQAPEHLPAGYEIEMWTPSRTRLLPEGLPLFPFGVWWLLYATGIFPPGYSVLVIRQYGTAVHRSVVTPKYSRFPFMGAADLQVGDVWTSEDHRGRGLASFALRFLLSGGDPARTYWYLTEESNKPSVRIAVGAGLRIAGHGTRNSRYGIRLLGHYDIDSFSGDYSGRIATPVSH